MLGTVHQERSSYHKDDIFNQDGSFVCWKQHYGHIWVRTNKYCISKVEFIRYSHRVIGEAMLSVSCESLPEFYDRGDTTLSLAEMSGITNRFCSFSARYRIFAQSFSFLPSLKFISQTMMNKDSTESSSAFGDEDLW